jgi:hypothetical protein
MTYPTAARIRYLVIIPFIGMGPLLDLPRGKALFFLGFALIFMFLGWMNTVVLRCPMCNRYAGKSKHCYQAPWDGPDCRWCGADLSTTKVSYRRKPRQT